MTNTAKKKTTLYFTKIELETILYALKKDISEQDYLFYKIDQAIKSFGGSDD